MKHIVLTGKFLSDYKKLLDTTDFKVHKVLRKNYILLAGSTCNNGRPITESHKYRQAIAHGIKIIREEIKPVSSQLLVDKYAPKTLGDVIGHREQINQLGEWLQKWSVDSEYKAVLITGPPGIGKTTTAHLVAKALDYTISEYNASDTRSASALKELFAFGVKRMRNDVIIMDEVDGISDRGGIGQIAEIIRNTHSPIICIANDRALKLKPLINICKDIKFSRPVKSTIATALEKIAKKEGIIITKTELETLCERNGNDIRAIINNLHFDATGQDKDSVLRLDPFSATQKLIGNKYLSIDEASNLVFVDYSMVPLMVSEGYLGASRDSLEDATKAADLLSYGDIMARKIHSTQDWTMLPHYVTNTVSIAKSVKGPAPFHIFPQWLGKNSKHLKHKRLVADLAKRTHIPTSAFRLDYCDAIQSIIIGNLDYEGGSEPVAPVVAPPEKKGRGAPKKVKPVDKKTEYVKGIITRMDDLNLTRDDLFDTIADLTFKKTEDDTSMAYNTVADIPTALKSAFTREFNKTTGKRKRKIVYNEIVEEGEVVARDDDDEYIDDTEDEDDGVIRIL